MKLTRSVFLFLLTGTLLLCACNAPSLPTPIPTVLVPTTTPTNAPPLPTRDLAQIPVATATPLPAFPTPLPPHPTDTPTPIAPIISIGQPTADVSLVLGSELTVSGLAQRNEGQTIWVTLITPDRVLLVDMPAEVSQSGGNTDGWRASFTVPEFIIGPAQIQATIRDSQNQIITAQALAVNLALDVNRTPRYITLDHPLTDQIAVAGYYLFMDGLTGLPTGGLLTMKILMDDCQTETAKFSFPITGGYGGYWYGYIGVPRNVAGPACAVATFGTPGEDTWRQALVPINILPKTDEAAAGIFIVSPASNSTALAGKGFALSGLAYNAIDDMVLVTITLDGGQVLSQGTAAVDDFGYWELTLTLPPDVEGSADISVITGLPGDEGYAETHLLITILPAEG
ncbi:MAG: hypothetical protein KC418_05460 [Anaerolineales bacterium]|nr:hypothetical protein [Anaerolineales bacterium]MCB8951252.1 hypothetical protein [Ardenticatenales bacterium]